MTVFEAINQDAQKCAKINQDASGRNFAFALQKSAHINIQEAALKMGSKKENHKILRHGDPRR